VSALLGEVPPIEPSFGFDARVRQRIAAEPQRSRFAWFVPQTRLALSAAMLVALTIFLVKLPPNRMPQPTPSIPQAAAAASSDQDFDAIKDLGVLENYDVLTKFDAMSESAAATAPQPRDKAQPAEPSSND
jgi:hypothetical protein